MAKYGHYRHEEADMIPGPIDLDRISERRGTESVKWDTTPDGTIPMWVADMDFPVADCIREAIFRRAVSDIYGYPLIPEALYGSYISWWSERHGMDIDREWMEFSTGVVPAINSIIRSMTGPSDKVLIQTPVYNVFFSSIRDSGRIPIEAPLTIKDGRYEMDFDSLERGLSDPGTGLMILCNPHNPVGRVWSAEDLARVAELCERYGVICISDEIHCDLTEPDVQYVPFLSVSDAARRIGIMCVSPSKTFNIAGIRSSMAVIPDRGMRERIRKGFSNDGISKPNTFAADATIAAFDQGGEWLDQVLDYISYNREEATSFIHEMLPELTLYGSEATYLLWIGIPYPIPDGKGPAEFLAKEAGVRFSEGSSFGECGKGFVRMNIACPRSILEEGLTRLYKGVCLLRGHRYRYPRQEKNSLSLEGMS